MEFRLLLGAFRNTIEILLSALFLLCSGCDTESRPSSYQGPYSGIHDAAGAGDVDSIRECLRSGVNVDVLDNHGEAALHHAAKFGKVDAAAFLIQQGAKVDSTSRAGGDTPLHYAVMFGRWDVAKILLQNGARGDQRNADGVSPREYAVRQGTIGKYEEAAKTQGDN